MFAQCRNVATDMLLAGELSGGREAKTRNSCFHSRNNRRLPPVFDPAEWFVSARLIGYGSLVKPSHA